MNVQRFQTCQCKLEFEMSEKTELNQSSVMHHATWNSTKNHEVDQNRGFEATAEIARDVTRCTRRLSIILLLLVRWPWRQKVGYWEDERRMLAGINNLSLSPAVILVFASKPTCRIATTAITAVHWKLMKAHAKNVETRKKIKRCWKSWSRRSCEEERSLREMIWSNGRTSTPTPSPTSGKLKTKTFRQDEGQSMAIRASRECWWLWAIEWARECYYKKNCYYNWFQDNHSSSFLPALLPSKVSVLIGKDEIHRSSCRLNTELSLEKFSFPSPKKEEKHKVSSSIYHNKKFL